jgi:hypothetical protein
VGCEQKGEVLRLSKEEILMRKQDFIVLVSGIISVLVGCGNETFTTAAEMTDSGGRESKDMDGSVDGALDADGACEKGNAVIGPMTMNGVECFETTCSAPIDCRFNSFQHSTYVCVNGDGGLNSAFANSICLPAVKGADNTWWYCC